MVILTNLTGVKRIEILVYCVMGHAGEQSACYCIAYVYRVQTTALSDRTCVRSYAGQPAIIFAMKDKMPLLDIESLDNWNFILSHPLPFCAEAMIN